MIKIAHKLPRELDMQTIWLSKLDKKYIHCRARYATISELNRPEPLAALLQSTVNGHSPLVALPLVRP